MPFGLHAGRFTVIWHFHIRFVKFCLVLKAFTEYLQCHIGLQLYICFINFDLVINFEKIEKKNFSSNPCFLNWSAAYSISFQTIFVDINRFVYALPFCQSAADELKTCISLKTRFTISALFPCFSVFSLFRLTQLVYLVIGDVV